MAFFFYLPKLYFLAGISRTETEYSNLKLGNINYYNHYIIIIIPLAPTPFGFCFFSFLFSFFFRCCIINLYCILQRGVPNKAVKKKQNKTKTKTKTKQKRNLSRQKYRKVSENLKILGLFRPAF